MNHVVTVTVAQGETLTLNVPPVWDDGAFLAAIGRDEAALYVLRRAVDMAEAIRVHNEGQL